MKKRNLENGDLHLAKVGWYLFPTQELASFCMNYSKVWGTDSPTAFANSASKKLKCNVCVIEPDTYIVLLEQNAEYYFKILDAKANVGWIYCWEFSKYFELMEENSNGNR